MLRVLSLASHPAGGFASMFLAESGAEVTWVTDTSVSSSGSMSSAQRLYFIRSSRRFMEHDLSSRTGRRAVLDLVPEHDVVIQDDGPGDGPGRLFRFRDLRRRNPRVVFTSITPFGLRGPRSTWLSSELVQQAMGGILFASGHDAGPPQRLAGFQSAHVAALHASIVTLAAIHGVREGRTPGVHIDVSIQEVMSTHWTREIGRYVYTGEETGRSSAELGLQGFPHTARARDGYLFLLSLRAEWEAFANFLGLDRFVTHEWSDAETRVRRWKEIEPSFFEAVQRKGRYDWFAEGAERGWTLAPVDDPLTVLDSPQLEARGFFKVATSDTRRPVRVPGLPFTVTPGIVAAQPNSNTQ